MLTDVSEVRTTSVIALIMVAVRTSETSVNIYLTTRQYIPEDSKLQYSGVHKIVSIHRYSCSWVFWAGVHVKLWLSGLGLVK
jgi:hypothetical protein